MANKHIYNSFIYSKKHISSVSLKRGMIIETTYLNRERIVERFLLLILNPHYKYNSKEYVHVIDLNNCPLSLLNKFMQMCDKKELYKGVPYFTWSKSPQTIYTQISPFIREGMYKTFFQKNKMYNMKFIHFKYPPLITEKFA